MLLIKLTRFRYNKLVTVVGHGAEKVKSHIGDESEFVLQEEQLGTAHAVMQAESLLDMKKEQQLLFVEILH